jgi:hypothetical protein
MSFLAPYMLWGTLAAGIPVAIHFFYRSRYRTVPWAAMKFLLASIEQTSRRLRFQELLLLITRVLLMLLIALALARPSVTASRGSAGGDAVDAVLVIDASLSMNARDGSPPPGAADDPYVAALKRFAAPDGSVTRFDRARAAALAVIDSLPQHSTVQVIAATDRSALLGPQAPAQLDQARQIIEELKPTHLGGDLLPAVGEAQTLILRGPSPNKELYLLGDMHRYDWERQAAALNAKVREIAGVAAVKLVNCATRAPANVSLVGITPQSSLHTGERADFAVLVRNTGKQPVQNLTVTLQIDGRPDRDSKPLPRLNPGETQAVILTGLLQRTGRQVITATVSDDDMGADNRYDQVIEVFDRVGILVVDGAPNELDPKRAASFFLQHALNPRAGDEGPGLPVYVVPADRASPKQLANKSLCVLADVALEPIGGRNVSVPPEFVKALGAFVRDGNNLLIFAGDRVQPEVYNRLLGEQLGVMPAKISGLGAAPDDKPLTLDRQSAESHPFQKFRQDEGYAGIDKVEVRRFLTVEPLKTGTADEARTLLKYSDGRAAVVTRRKLGEGEVMLFTTSAHDGRWSDWFVSPPFVPFVQVALNYLLEGQPLTYNRVAGEPLRWQPPRNLASAAFDLIAPDGSRARVGYPETVEGRPLLTATETPRGGVYKVAPAGGALTTDGEPASAGAEAVPFAVIPDLRETEDLDSFTEAQMRERLGPGFVWMTAADDGSAFGGAERLKREWTPWLLAAVLVLVMFEAALAWWCGRAW